MNALSTTSNLFTLLGRGKHKLKGMNLLILSNWQSLQRKQSQREPYSAMATALTTMRRWQEKRAKNRRSDRDLTTTGTHTWGSTCFDSMLQPDAWLQSSRRHLDPGTDSKTSVRRNDNPLPPALTSYYTPGKNPLVSQTCQGVSCNRSTCCSRSYLYIEAKSTSPRLLGHFLFSH